MAIDSLGWTATAVFVASYLCKRSRALKRVQMAGALIWIVYGLLMGAAPVVVANALVFGAAGWALLTDGGEGVPIAPGERRSSESR
jgi:hypothetical protein